MKVMPVIKFVVAANIIKAAVLLPQKTGNPICERNKDIFEKELVELSRPYEEKLLDDLNIIEETNFRGGVIHKFEDESVRILKERLMKDTVRVEYQLPIENAKNVYLERGGMFMAKRPQGRPHLGLDIFVTPYARKPKKPVVVSSPVNGVVISHKHARENDNVIANSVTILGVDGRRYAFEHLAKASDYKDYDSIPLPHVGTYMHKGDSIGYVGRTGETSLWHLHFSVMTDEQLEKQKNDKKWLKIQANSPYSQLRGQVDPLNEVDAGPLAKLISSYNR